MSDVLAKLEDRIKRWENNSDKARVSVKLGLLRELRNALAAAPQAADDARADPIAWFYELANAVIHHDDGRKEYVDWKKHVSFTPPCAGDAQRNVTPLYAAPDALQTQVENLTRALARHEAHEYEQRAWAAEAQVEELTQQIWDSISKSEARGIQIKLDAATAQIGALREAVKVSKALLDNIAEFGTITDGEFLDAAYVAVDAALAATEPLPSPQEPQG
jgi:hypothetical protein